MRNGHLAPKPLLSETDESSVKISNAKGKLLENFPRNKDIWCKSTVYRQEIKNQPRACHAM